MRRWLVASSLAIHLLGAALAQAAGVPIEKARKEQLKAAQRTFEAADGLFDAKRYQEAITTYRASYEIVASPNSRLMIARALTALGRLEEAHTELLGAVSDAKAAAAADQKYAPTLKAAEAELAALEAKVGRIELVLDAALKDAKITVGARTLAGSDATRPIVVAPGEVVVVASLGDGRSVRREVSVAAGATETVKLELPADATPTPVAAPPEHTAPTPPAERSRPEPAKPTSLRPYAYVAGGIGVAGLATFAVFGLMNKSKFDDLESSCTDGHCGSGRQDEIDAGRRYQTIANVGLVVGAVGLGAGVTLFLLSKGSAKTEQPTALELHLAPGFASLGGRFQ